MRPKSRDVGKAEMQRLVDRLRGAGLRRTGSRIAVLDRLARADAPVSHAEVADILEPLDFDRATVYRNLVDLVEVNLAKRVDLGDHVWRFSLIRENEPMHGLEHPHLVCDDCGAVICRPDIKVEIAAERALQPLEVQLRGQCDDCGNPPRLEPLARPTAPCRRELDDREDVT